jgi:hypothetical protein
MTTERRLLAALRALLRVTQDAFLCSRRDWRVMRIAKRALVERGVKRWGRSGA